MKNTIADYLNKRADLSWPLIAPSRMDAAEAAVVIPSLAEREYLFDVLHALAQSSLDAQERTLIICVVNNRSPEWANPADIENNRQTLLQLKQDVNSRCFGHLRIAWIDASSPGCELPAKEGVGLARKIGLDHALLLLSRNNQPEAPLVCLDADAPPAPGYLDAVLAFYAKRQRWCGYAAYEHPIPDDDTAAAAVIAYELYLRHYELGLRWAGSPYAFPALGSIASCTARAYAAVSGMNRKCAGEDFYFMQQLAKTGTVEHLPGALVHPSGRGSRRTPFGTGQAIASGAAAHALLYHPECFRILRDWLTAVHHGRRESSDALLHRASTIHPELTQFLFKRRFAEVWEQTMRPILKDSERECRFHVWFDGLRTIQLIHHLRDRAYPSLPSGEAVLQLLERQGLQELTVPTASQRDLLELLRRLCYVSPARTGVRHRVDSCT